MLLDVSNRIIRINILSPEAGASLSYMQYLKKLSLCLVGYIWYMYCRLSLSRSKDSLKYFEISVHRQIRIAELREKIEQPNFTNEYLIWSILYILKYCGKEEKLLLGSNSSSLPQVLCYLLLDFYVKTWTRISFRDKRLFETSEAEITRVDCIVIIASWIFALLRINRLCSVIAALPGYVVHYLAQ